MQIVLIGHAKQRNAHNLSQYKCQLLLNASEYFREKILWLNLKAFYIIKVFKEQ